MRNPKPRIIRCWVCALFHSNAKAVSVWVSNKFFVSDFCYLFSHWLMRNYANLKSGGFEKTKQPSLALHLWAVQQIETNIGLLHCLSVCVVSLVSDAWEERGRGHEMTDRQSGWSRFRLVQSSYRPQRVALGKGCEADLSQWGPRFATRGVGFEWWRTPVSGTLRRRRRKRRRSLEVKLSLAVSCPERLNPRRPAPERCHKLAVGGTGWCHRGSRGKTGVPERWENKTEREEWKKRGM